MSICTPVIEIGAGVEESDKRTPEGMGRRKDEVHHVDREERAKELEFYFQKPH